MISTITKVLTTLAKSKRGIKILKYVVGTILGIFVLIIGAFFTLANGLSNGSHDLFSGLYKGFDLKDIKLKNESKS